jgi:hypothetical protein
MDISTETTSKLTVINYIDHFAARWGINRGNHRVDPGLYRLGTPSKESSVFVTANYTLSFDALRKSLHSQHAWILVLDTKGVNVWCAAGKGTFGTEELCNRIETTQLKDHIQHKNIILPQLGAPGISAHEVKKLSGFNVIYGPVRASDIPEYIKTGNVTTSMRHVTFRLWDRFILTPIEIRMTLIPLLIGSIVAYFLDGTLGTIATISAIFSGTLFFPLLLPWIPTKSFSSKGFILGFVTMIIIAHFRFHGYIDQPLWHRGFAAGSYFLLFPPITSFLSLNFTGSTTFTSKTGVTNEMKRYMRPMAILFGTGIIAQIVLKITSIAIQ